VDYNVILKFSKTWLGFTKVHFFGYDCTHKFFELSAKRKDEISDFNFPASQKDAQRFLGTAAFFAGFVPKFADLCAPIHELAGKKFDWDKSTWKRDYAGDFEVLKSALKEACAVYYPDYELTWILRTDASDLAVGAVLIQLFVHEDKSVTEQALGFASQKLSAVAQRWSTYEKEAYAVYFGVNYFQYYLRGKHFIVETDHKNLRWMEGSMVPKVIRWRMYLQSFDFLIRHIPGRSNSVADWQSRPGLAVISNSLSTVDDLIARVHGGRAGHHGSRRTWAMLNEQYPGHPVRFSDVDNFIRNCPICQKTRLLPGPWDVLPPVIRHLKVPHARHMLAVDILSVTPVDENGYGYIVVIVNMFTRFTSLYPTKDKSALSLANSLFHYVVYFGACSYLRSDPGSDLTSEAVALVNKWFGLHHSLSIVDRPQSNGVEPVNKAVLRFLRSIVYDERLIHKWSTPSVIHWVAFLINTFYHSEAGVIPFEATFGSTDAKYYNFLDTSAHEASPQFVKDLSENLRLVRQVAHQHQHELIRKRTSKNPAVPTVYKPGDLVLLVVTKPASKLTPKYSGPYTVIDQVKNDVHVRHLIRDSVSVVHVERLKIFRGSIEDANFR
jgi:hypothetical protein